MANWDIIKKIKETVSIPVFANGNIQHFEDIEKCMKYTGADGVMSAETLLYNPALFSNTHVDQITMAQEYLDFCKIYETPNQMIRPQ
jgi:tRNA-dihydrouridine synthase 1